ncbi:MAG: hypothetical protein M0030_22005 [Actinomycetota bacterium]|nr:hypothetical protein [Actinomycetota bacterium]
MDDQRWRQPPVSPPGLLNRVAILANSARGAVYNRWGPEYSDHGIRRWDVNAETKPRDAFVAEAKIVSFWHYRQGALAIADRFEMSLTETAASYLRALGAWAADNPVLAACVPTGPPQCIEEDLKVLARRRLARGPGAGPGPDAMASRLAGLASDMVAAILDDASLTTLGAFNVIRGEVLRLLGEPPDPVAVKLSNALSELADRILHHDTADQVLTASQARQLQAELAALAGLLDSAASEPRSDSSSKPREESGQ